MTNLERHKKEIQANFYRWHKSPTLQALYKGFHQEISRHLSPGIDGLTVELGSGAADIRKVIPNCLRTDIFLSPCIDQVENAYQLSFADKSVANLILFDVFHHLRYPGTAFSEFHRVLKDSGRVILFEPCVSWLGRLIYGVLHPEPLALEQPIQWTAPLGWSPTEIDYYAAQGNASRIFIDYEFDEIEQRFSLVKVQRFSAISYVASGGYSKPQLYPDNLLPLMYSIDRLCDGMPHLFATRLLVVLQKSG